MLHFVKSRRHFTFVKPNYINCFCFSHEVVVSKMRQFYGISYLAQRNTHVFAIFILRWNICSHFTKFAYFYKNTLVVSMREFFHTICVIHFQFKLTQNLSTHIFQGPQTRLDFEYPFFLLHNTPYRCFRRLSCPLRKIDNLV